MRQLWIALTFLVIMAFIFGMVYMMEVVPDKGLRLIIALISGALLGVFFVVLRKVGG